ncbi:MAG: S49 family peptidase [Burkholderiaceae bacterium]
MNNDPLQNNPLRDEPPAAPVQSGATVAPSMPAGPSTAEAMERILNELIRDRRAERRWRSFFRLAWLLVAIALVWILAPSRGLSAAPAGPHTALVDLRGEIHEEGLASADAVISALRDAFGNPNARAVVIRINSPGGSPVQAGMINDEIRRLKDLHQKKVYAVVEEICASGAYYVAVAADEIYVDKASLVGSIGVLMEGFGFSELMSKVGIERRLITAGENKGMLDPYTPQTAREREHAQALINQIHQQFIGVVKEGRGERLKATPDTFSGLFWNGEEAVRIGLADGMASLDSVARDKAQAPDVVDYSPRENVAERLAKRFGASVGAGAMQAIRAMAGEARPNVVGGSGAAPAR